MKSGFAEHNRMYLPVISGVLLLFFSTIKIFALTSFINILCSILHVSNSTGLTLAVALLIIELGSGILMLMRYYVRTISFVSVFLFCSYLTISLVTFVQGKQLQALMLGFLNSSMSLSISIIILIGIINIFLITGVFWKDQNRKPIHLAWYIWIIIIFSEVCLFVFANDIRLRKEYKQYSGAITYFEKISPGFSSFSTKRRCIYFINFFDFNCPPCYETFQILNQVLSHSLDSLSRERVIIAFRQDNHIMDSTNPNRLKEWKKGNDIILPVVITSDSLFINCKIEKSKILVLDQNHILCKYMLPLTEHEINKIFEYLN